MARLANTTNIGLLGEVSGWSLHDILTRRCIIGSPDAIFTSQIRTGDQIVLKDNLDVNPAFRSVVVSVDSNRTLRIANSYPLPHLSNGNIYNEGPYIGAAASQIPLLIPGTYTTANSNSVSVYVTMFVKDLASWDQPAFYDKRGLFGANTVWANTIYAGMPVLAAKGAGARTYNEIRAVDSNSTGILRFSLAGKEYFLFGTTIATSAMTGELLLDTSSIAGMAGTSGMSVEALLDALCSGSFSANSNMGGALSISRFSNVAMPSVSSMSGEIYWTATAQPHSNAVSAMSVAFNWMTTMPAAISGVSAMTSAAVLAATPAASISATSGAAATLTSTHTEIITTTGAGSMTVPAGVTSMKFECVGGGSGGYFIDSAYNGGGGGGGGSYARTNAVSVTAGHTVYWNVAAGAASGTAGNQTWVRYDTNSAPSSTTDGCLAKGGSLGVDYSTGGVGGLTSTSVGDVKYAGGNGGSVGGGSGGGGGGAAGPSGTGKAGAASPYDLDWTLGGGGGGGANGGSSSTGGAPSGTSGGPGGAGTSGSGGGNPGGNGAAGGGGGGGETWGSAGGAGGSDTAFSATRGCGGGGGGGGGSYNGGNGGDAGGGGGGAGCNYASYAGTGAAGILIITYTITS